MPEDIREILEEHGVVEAPKLPVVDKLVGMARVKRCHITVVWPEETDLDVLATVRIAGLTFRHEHREAGLAVACAVAEALEATQPTQLELEE